MMLSSVLMSAALAAVVLAKPMQHFDKRAIVTVYAEPVTETDIVATVTVYDLPASDVARVANKDSEQTAGAPPNQGGWQRNGNGNGGVRGGQTHQVVTSEVKVFTQPPAAPTSSPRAKPSQAPDPPQSDSPPAAPNNYQELTVYHHNLHRRNHSAPDIQWSDELASSSQQIAESCVYAHNTKVAGGGYGQNIAAGVQGSDISTIITELFYNGEVNYFNGQYGKPNPDMTNFEKWGHFSQIVWNTTTHVGCYTQHCPNGLANVGAGVSPYFTVCNYKEPGNVSGAYAQHINAPNGDPTAH